MKAYSIDFRTKIVEAYQRGEGSQRDIAARFNVSLTFVRDLMKLVRETGSIQPRAAHLHFHRTSKVNQDIIDFTDRLLSIQPSLSLAQLCEKLAHERNVHISRATLWRALVRNRRLDHIPEARVHSHRSQPPANVHS
jgi:transposase